LGVARGFVLRWVITQSVLNKLAGRSELEDWAYQGKVDKPLESLQQSGATMTRKHKTYDPAFKTQAIQLATTPGSTIQGTAKNLGIGYSTLTRWLAEEKDQTPTLPNKPNAARTSNPSIQALEEENQRLRRENEVLRQEHEILKSAAKFFTKESR
jgi:transposase